MTATKPIYLFIGVGGMGMAPLAAWMSHAGYSVYGCDDNLQENVRRFLVDSGVGLKDFLLNEQLKQFDRIVYSSAVKLDHPFLKAASELGLETLRRGEMLAEIAASKRLVAIVGSHGKTTVSGAIVHAIRRCAVDVNYIIGGMFSDKFLPPSHYADSDWLVAEVDESDGTIDQFSPEMTVLLNIDWDHADHYSTREMLEATFQSLIDRTKKYVLLSAEGDLTQKFTKSNGVKHLTFGSKGDFRSIVEANGDLKLSGEFEAMHIKPSGGGRIHHINDTAALAVLKLLSIQWPTDVLSSFGGMARRQTILHRDDQWIIFEDYAHHHTEIVAALETLRAMAPDHQLAVVFQPHRYTRTSQFKHDLVTALRKADQLFLLPVYAAHEQIIESGTTEAFVQAFNSNLPEVLQMNYQGVDRLFRALGKKPTLLAFIGAGDIHLFAGMFTSMYRSEFDPERAWRDFVQERVSPECVLKEYEPLANKTTMRIGGAARFYAEPGNLADLRILLGAAKLFGLETFCLGRGSNILVLDDGFKGLVIRFSSPAWRCIELLDNGRIWAAAGVRLKELCGYAAKVGLTGFEFLEGIPGTVGGALRMNAGAMGKWIFDVVEQVQFLDESGNLRNLPKDYFHVEYRKVEEISRGIALGAVLKSVEVEKDMSIRDRMDEYATVRKSSQPRNPSAGCIFKNPEGDYAGKLIDTYGLKGMRVGGAEVSNIHGNFIVNRGGASAEDVVELVQQVRDSIYVKSGYLLEPEVLLLGHSWDTLLNKKNLVNGQKKSD